MTENNFALETTFIKIILGAVPTLIKDKVERTEIVIKLKKKLGLNPDHPPEDFTGVYKHAMVEYGVEKPEPILELLRQKEIVQAFRQSFQENDSSILHKAGEKYVFEYALGDEIQELRINIHKEFTEFKDVFIDVAKRTRKPLLVLLDQSIDNLLSIDNLWQQLQALGSRTDKIGPILVEEDTLGMWRPQSIYPKVLRLGSRIRLEVNLEIGGHLLLLEKNPEGQVWSLCPSFLAPESHLKPCKTILPQKDAPIKIFQLEGALGLEQIMAVITKEAPALDWLPQGSDEPLQLDKSHLTQLIKYVNSIRDYKVIYTEYTVTGIS